MKEMVDIHVVLATEQDMEDFDEHASLACENLNHMLHYLYDQVDEDIDIQRLERIIQHVWEYWSKDQHLTEIDQEDLHDWVDHLLATWDDDDSTSQFDAY